MAWNLCRIWKIAVKITIVGEWDFQIEDENSGIGIISVEKKRIDLNLGFKHEKKLNK